MGTTGEILDLDRLEALAAAATEGPWMAGLNGGVAMVVSRDFGPGRLPRQFRADCGHFDQDRADAAFIAEARTAVPAIIADNRRLRTGVADLLAMLDAHQWDGSQVGPLYHGGMTFAYEDVAARLRALVEGR